MPCLGKVEYKNEKSIVRTKRGRLHFAGVNKINTRSYSMYNVFIKYLISNK